MVDLLEHPKQGSTTLIELSKTQEAVNCLDAFPTSVFFFC